jgi:hypothetical protein
MTNLLNDQLKITKISDNITIVDNILKDYIVNFLRLRIQIQNRFDTFYEDYQAIDYFLNSDSLTKDLSYEIKNKFKLNNFNRAWSLVYNEKSNGVFYHQDFDSKTTVNIWVTPDECIKDVSKNGLYIWDQCPPDWQKMYSDYKIGCRHRCIDEFVKENEKSIIKIDYKCNRAIFFPGNFLHETVGVETVDGFLNRRVSYTMLFGGNQ